MGRDQSQIAVGKVGRAILPARVFSLVAADPFRREARVGGRSRNNDKWYRSSAVSPGSPNRGRWRCTDAGLHIYKVTGVDVDQLRSFFARVSWIARSSCSRVVRA